MLTCNDLENVRNQSLDGKKEKGDLKASGLDAWLQLLFEVCDVCNSFSMVVVFIMLKLFKFTGSIRRCRMF